MAVDDNSPIFLLENILKRDTEHLLVEDFNFHHEIWNFLGYRLEDMVNNCL